MLGDRGKPCYYCGDDTYVKKVVISIDRIVLTYRCERCKATEKTVLKKDKNKERPKGGYLKFKPLMEGGY
jgi:hypothetical protein